MATKKILAVSLLVLALTAVGGPASAVDEGGGEARNEPGASDLQRLKEENAALSERLRLLEACSVSRDDLLRRNLARLQGVARDVKAQRQTMADFEGYIRWMSGSLSSYAKYVEAGSAAAGLAKYLPIPYAGQAGMFAKFVAHFALSLNGTSNAITKYLATSQQFVARANALDPSKPLDAKEIAALGRFADERLLAETADVQARLATISDLSASTLAFLEAMNHYVGSAGEYWSKTKQFVTQKEPDPKDRSYLSEATAGLRTQAAAFNAKLRLFDDVTKREAPVVGSLAAYDELVRDLDARRVAQAP
jgi:hypothetical protein